MQSGPAPDGLCNNGGGSPRRGEGKEQPYRETEMLRERLSRLSHASMRINEGLDVGAV